MPNKLLSTLLLNKIPLTTRLVLIVPVLLAVSPWMGLLSIFMAFWLRHLERPYFSENVSRAKAASIYAFFSLLWAVWMVFSSYVPTDDLARHLRSWELGYDYRLQYPWSNVPKESLWIGFDMLLGQLQAWGAAPQKLIKGVPSVALLLNAFVWWVVLTSITRSAPKKQGLVFLFAAMAWVVTMPRMTLGRPEAFMAALSALAWICRTRAKKITWVIGFLGLVPFYWLGWVYAPMVFLMPCLRLRAKFIASVGLAAAHLGFWQLYTGDYLEVLTWVKGTLSVPASENASLMTAIGDVSGWLLPVIGGWAFAYKLKEGKDRMSLLVIAAGLLWFSLPDQIRYQPMLAYVLIPFILKTVVEDKTVEAWLSKFLILPAMALPFALCLSLIATIPPSRDYSKFSLPAGARVLSQDPFMTVFHAKGRIAVEPSFAAGATLPEWKNIWTERSVDCRKLKDGGFTYVVEKTFKEIPNCVTLSEVQKDWRLWQVNY